MKKTDIKIRKSGRPLSFDRDAALKQAMLAFWRHGFEATSISDLTAAMGVTPPSIYTAFGDKKHLFLEAARLYAGSPEALDASLQAAPTARDAARQMLIASAHAFTDPATPRGCLLASSTASVSHQAEDVQQAVTGIRLDIMARLQRRIEQDVSGGLLPASTPAAALASMIIALIQGMSVLARDGAGRQSLIDMADIALAAWPQGKVQ